MNVTNVTKVGKNKYDLTVDVGTEAAPVHISTRWDRRRETKAQLKERIVAMKKDMDTKAADEAAVKEQLTPE